MGLAPYRGANAYTAYENCEYADALIEQISLFCYQPWAGQRLKAVLAFRDLSRAHTIAALTALHEKLQRRPTQHKEQPPAAEKAPVEDHDRDPGSEF